MIDYPKRLVEVDEILNFLNRDELKKIPKNVRQLIKDNKDTEYVWKYSEEKPLKDQNLSRDTIALLSYLNMEYILNDEQKQIMKEYQELNEKKQEQERIKKYNPDDLFKKHEVSNNIITNENESKENNNLPVKIEKESFISRVINMIKNFCKKTRRK